jgi:hypothetical protein
VELRGDLIVIYVVCLVSSFSVLSGAQKFIIVMSTRSQKATYFPLPYIGLYVILLKPLQMIRPASNLCLKYRNLLVFYVS